MNAWLEFFFGSPRRVMVTILIVIALVPPLRYWFLQQVEDVAAALMFPAIMLGIIIYAFRRMLGPLFSGGSRRH